MGMNFYTNDSVAPWYTPVRPPVKRGLEAWFNFDTDAARFYRNRAQNKPDADMIGSPVAFSAFGRFKGLSNFLQTKVPESDEMTLIVVGRAAHPVPGGSTVGDENTPFYVGNYRGQAISAGVEGTSYGTNLFHVSPTTLVGGSSRKTDTGVATSAQFSLPNEVPTDWGIRVLRTSSAKGMTVQNITKGTTAHSPDVRQRVLTDTLFRIGGGTYGFAAEVDISAVIMHSVWLSDLELNQQIALPRARMARLGISV